jgi:hypothetical protein
MVPVALTGAVSTCSPRCLAQCASDFDAQGVRNKNFLKGGGRSVGKG